MALLQIASDWTRPQIDTVLDALAPVVEVIGGDFDGFEQEHDGQPITGDNFKAWANESLDLLLLDPDQDDMDMDDKHRLFVSSIGQNIGDSLMMASMLALIDPSELNAPRVESGREALSTEESYSRLREAQQAFEAARDVVTEQERQNRIAQGMDLTDPEPTNSDTDD